MSYFFVLYGTGVVEIGEEKETAGKNSLIESPKDIPRCWYNRSNAPLRFIVIKVPKPEKPTKFIKNIADTFGLRDYLLSLTSVPF